MKVQILLDQPLGETMNALSDTQSWIVFLLIAYGIVIGVMDYYTTMIALQHGDVELNPVAKWLQKWAGITYSTVISLAAFIIGGTLAAAHWGTPILYGLRMALAGETVNVAENFRFLKKQGISLK